MLDKPKGGMRQKKKKHKDEAMDKKLIDKMVKSSCMKRSK
jgi:hypothetical protein